MCRRWTWPAHGSADRAAHRAQQNSVGADQRQRLGVCGEDVERVDDRAATPLDLGALSPEASLSAGIEGATGQAGHQEGLPFLGMARAELVDYGRRRPAQLLDIRLGDVRAGLRELDDQLTTLLADSEVLQHSLRLDGARGYLRRGMRANG
jgi:hypothetical protein